MTFPFRFAVLAALCAAVTSATGASLLVQVNDSSGKPLADVVVVADAQGGVAMPRPLKSAEIAQRGLAFIPLVSVLQTGSLVSFPNNDKVKHHIYSFSPAKKFDQKLYSGVAAAPQLFDKAGLVVLGCNIHDSMVAYIKVVDSPYFAKTGADGVARIEVPGNARYSVSAWHYNMSGATLEQSVVFKGDSAPPVAFKVPLKPIVAEVAAPGY